MSAAASEVILGWLNSAIAGRERVAGEAASEAGGTWSEDPFVFGVRDEKNALVAKSRDNRASSIVHIALTDPESVLRHCAADRKLMELHQPVILRNGGGAAYFETTRVCRSCETPKQFPETAWPCLTLLALAEGYGWTGGNR